MDGEPQYQGQGSWLYTPSRRHISACHGRTAVPHIVLCRRRPLTMARQRNEKKGVKGTTRRCCAYACNKCTRWQGYPSLDRGAIGRRRLVSRLLLCISGFSSCSVPLCFHFYSPSARKGLSVRARRSTSTARCAARRACVHLPPLAALPEPPLPVPLVGVMSNSTAGVPRTARKAR